MLFTNDELKSVYDFEHDPDEIPDNMATIAALAKEIKRILDKLCDIIEFNNEQKNKKKKEYKDPEIKIGVDITDNYGKPIIIDEKRLFDSKTALQLDVAKELNPTRTIPKQLALLGINAPNKESPDYKRYLQLLYFFFMARYVIFQENFFIDFDVKRRTTSELSPVDRASSGKYIYFILNNVIENDAVYRRCVHRDEWLSKFEWATVQCLDELLTENNPPVKNEVIAESIQKIIDSAKEMTIESYVESNLLDRMAE